MDSVINLCTIIGVFIVTFFVTAVIGYVIVGGKEDKMCGASWAISVGALVVCICKMLGVI